MTLLLFKRHPFFVALAAVFAFAIAFATNMLFGLEWVATNLGVLAAVGLAGLSVWWSNPNRAGARAFAFGAPACQILVGAIVLVHLGFIQV